VGTIPAEWVASGNGEVRNRVLWKTRDRLAYVVYWECGDVEFTWSYTVDEAMVVVGGEAFISDLSGNERHYQPGDTAFFAAGTKARWRVPRQVSKVAFVKDPVWWPLALASRVLKRLGQAFGGSKVSL